MAGLPVYVPVVSRCDTLRRTQVSTPLPPGLPCLPLPSEANTGRWLLSSFAHAEPGGGLSSCLRGSGLSHSGQQAQAILGLPRGLGPANRAAAEPRQGAMPAPRPPPPTLRVLEAGPGPGGPGSLRHTEGRHMSPGKQQPAPKPRAWASPCQAPAAPGSSTSVHPAQAPSCSGGSVPTAAGCSQRARAPAAHRAPAPATRLPDTPQVPGTWPPTCDS